ncbi:MAG: amidohydrolase [Chlorobium sp.]|uniref:M20 metallopeptidase family protein n=1 Tax=Chlorobium sp. TaxID=1095 RepID=UPI002F40271A
MFERRDNPLASRIREEAERIYPEIVDLRRAIHACPELSYEEFRTTASIEKYLRAIGIEPEPPFLETGVTAIIKGCGTAIAGRRRSLLALRADIDALPVNEENSHAFCSREPGKMHACGHDMHTAMLLGAAKILLTFRSELNGDVLLIFQPAEEKAPGGARPLIEAGLFERFQPQAIFGQHCFPSVEAGTVALSGGSFMAATDEIYITVNGRGGHASAPHKAADPVLAAAHIITAVQHLVSRVAPPHEPAVVSIASIHGGNAPNVIPSAVAMSGTMRTMNESLRTRLKERLLETVTSTASALGVSAELEIRTGYPALINDPAMTDEAEGYCIEFLGKQNVKQSEPLMTAEDFAYYLQQIPGTFWQIGTGDGQAEQRGNTLHSSTFDPVENVLATGSGLLAYTALRFFM